jgi:hypothetical protein
MGINFLYIGHDETTLKDKLQMEIRMDELPIEMNITSAFALGMPPVGSSANANVFDPFGFLGTFGIPTELILNFIPRLPKGINVSDPLVDAPPFAPLQPPNISSLLPGLPESSTVSNTPVMNMLDGMLKTYVPGVPKDFSFSKVFVPGGVVLSEIEPLIEGIMNALGLKIRWVTSLVDLLIVF